MADPQISVRIRDREQVVFEGQVRALTSVNNKGRFDILPEHANFISLLKEEISLLMLDGSEKKIEVKVTGVLKVNKGQVRVYLGV